MNTKFSFALLVIVIAIIATACAPAIIDSSAPIVQAVQPADKETSALLPVTGASDPTAVRDSQEPRLWSGEIFFSDNGNPDYVQNAVPSAAEAPQTECTFEDSLPRRQSGCVE